MKEIEINAMYNKPEMQIIELGKIYVITTSGDGPFPGEDDEF